MSTWQQEPKRTQKRPFRRGGYTQGNIVGILKQSRQKIWQNIKLAHLEINT
jgi:hypothetical protein